MIRRVKSKSDEELELEAATAICVNMKRLREGQGLTQAVLAARAGVTVETVARLERVLRDRSSANQNPSLGTLVRLSKALGCSLSQLIGEKSSKVAAKMEHDQWRRLEAERLRKEADRLERGL